MGDLGSIPELRKSPGGGHGNPLQYCCLVNSHGQRSLEGYNPWGCKESDTTKYTLMQGDVGLGLSLVGSSPDLLMIG